MSYPSNKIIIDRKDPELVNAPEIGSRELFINRTAGTIAPISDAAAGTTLNSKSLATT